jgi:hypothetical protein
MKKLVFILVIVALLSLFSAALVQAQPAVPEYGAESVPVLPLEPGEQGGPWVFPTMVDREFYCGLGPYGHTFYSQAVMTRNGIQSLVCAGQVPSGEEPDRPVVEEGFVCGLRFLGIFSTVSRLTVTPSGRVIMTCHTMQSVHE